MNETTSQSDVATIAMPTRIDTNGTYWCCASLGHLTVVGDLVPAAVVAVLAGAVVKVAALT